MEKIKKKTPNILVVLSTVLFIFASAFTLVPGSESVDSEQEVIITQAEAPCSTCDFGESGPPSGVCAPAAHCGMDGICRAGSPCVMGGGLCGECAEEVEPL